MKKLFFSGCVLMTSLTSFSQNVVVDFEDLPLTTANSYYNGSDEVGYFSSSSLNIRFSNEYTAAWSSWTGFAYSNVNNTTTAGFQNQYAAFAGSGANNSSNYVIYNDNGVISFPEIYHPNSFQITNTTYAALSMRDGDGFGKQFGTTVNGSGEIDGTDGKDFFKVWIYGLDENQTKIDSLEFYLADFRSDNAADHYILNTWETVDISALGSVHGLTFKMESSDNGVFGMNTPAYFAMDNLQFEGIASSETLSKNELEVYPNPVKDILYINGGNGTVTLIDVTGKNLLTLNHTTNSVIDMNDFQSGIYYVIIEMEGNIITRKIQK